MFKKSLIALGLIAVSASSYAQFYLQGAIGQGTVNAQYAGVGATDTKKSSTGNKFVIGYSLGSNWSVEANAIDYGKSVTNVTASSPAEFKVTGMGLGGAYTFANTNSKWSFRIGLSLNNNKVNTITAASNTSETSSQLNIDFGAAYKLTDTVNVIAAIDSSSVKYTGNNYGVSLLSVGIRANF